MAMDNQKDLAPPTLGNILSREFLLGFFAFFTFLVAFFALLPTLPVYLKRLGSGEGEIGVLVGIYSIASLGSRLLAGGALLRYPEKAVMAFAALLFAITFPACILFQSFWPIFVTRIFQGIAYACLDTAIFAFIIKVTPLPYRGHTLGYFMLAPGIATVIAPSFGMFLVNRFGFTALFLFCMGLSLCALLFSGIITGYEPRGKAWTLIRGKPRGIDPVGLKGAKVAAPTNDSPKQNAFFLERKVIVPAISAFFYNFVMGSVMAFLALFAIQQGVTNPGYFFSASALMTITGRSLGAKILNIWSKERIIMTFTCTSMIAMIMLSLSTTLPMFIAVGLLWGAGVAFIFPVSMAYALDYGDSSGGTAIGTFRAVMDLGTAAGPMIMGLVIPLAGYSTMFLCLAAVCLINLCYFQFYVKKKREEVRGMQKR
jgi:MFS family permease